MKVNEVTDKSKFIKFAAVSYMGAGGDPVKLFTESAEWLFDCYKRTNDKICLDAAVQLVKSYIEFGLLYEEGNKLFDKILRAAGETLPDDAGKRVGSENVLKRKNAQIREVLGYWPKLPDKVYDADWVVADILKKLQDNECGCYYYGKKEEEIDFELLILPDNAYLVDLCRRKVHVFEEV